TATHDLRRRLSVPDQATAATRAPGPPPRVANGESMYKRMTPTLVGDGREEEAWPPGDGLGRDRQAQAGGRDSGSAGGYEDRAASERGSVGGLPQDHEIQGLVPGTAAAASRSPVDEQPHECHEIRQQGDQSRDAVAGRNQADAAKRYKYRDQSGDQHA